MDLPSYLRPIEQVLSGTVTSEPSPITNNTMKPSVSPTYLQDHKRTTRFMLVSTHIQQYTGYSK